MLKNGCVLVDRQSVFIRPFVNTWLNLAIIWELLLLALIVYLPVLHTPFSTYSLPPIDWGIVLSLALTVIRCWKSPSG